MELLGHFQRSTVVDDGRENDYAGSIFTTPNEWSGIVSFAAFGRRERVLRGIIQERVVKSQAAIAISR